MVRLPQPVHRLTRTDDAFVAMFLIVYRRFARPGDVLAKLIERYEYISARLEAEPLLSRYAHMRCVRVQSVRPDTSACAGRCCSGSRRIRATSSRP